MSLVCERLAGELASPSEKSLVDFEASLDDLLVEYRTFLDEVTPRSKRTPVSRDYESFFRAMVSLSTIVTLASGKIQESLRSRLRGAHWGEHLFSAADFARIGFDHIDHGMPSSAVRRIMPDQVADFENAFEAITDFWPLRPVRATLLTRVRQWLDDVLVAHGTARLPSAHLGFALVDTDYALAQLHRPPTDRAWIAREVRARRLIAVPMWAGEMGFPAYQFLGGHVIDSVKFVCANAVPSMKGWALAIWMAKNFSRDLASLEDELADRGLWKPRWTAKPTTALDSIDTDKLTDSKCKSPLFRITDDTHSPFYFSPSEPPKRGRSTGGRFDLPKASGLGTFYCAETAMGAWSECLDRLPVVTLKELLHRDVWVLQHDRNRAAAELLRGWAKKVTTSDNRADTQALARRVYGSGHLAMRSHLRTQPGEVGIALFGPAGPNLPGTAGLGNWSAKREAGLTHSTLWDYVADRDTHQSTWPVVLRRFPTEIQVR